MRGCKDRGRSANGGPISPNCIYPVLKKAILEGDDPYFDYDDSQSDDVVLVADRIQRMFPNHSWNAREHKAFATDNTKVAQHGLIGMDHSEDAPYNVNLMITVTNDSLFDVGVVVTRAGHTHRLQQLYRVPLNEIKSHVDRAVRMILSDHPELNESHDFNYGDVSTELSNGDPLPEIIDAAKEFGYHYEEDPVWRSPDNDDVKYYAHHFSRRTTHGTSRWTHKLTIARMHDAPEYPHPFLYEYFLQDDKLYSQSDGGHCLNGYDMESYLISKFRRGHKIMGESAEFMDYGETLSPADADQLMRQFEGYREVNYRGMLGRAWKKEWHGSYANCAHQVTIEPYEEDRILVQHAYWDIDDSDIFTEHTQYPPQITKLAHLGEHDLIVTTTAEQFNMTMAWATRGFERFCAKRERRMQNQLGESFFDYGNPESGDMTDPAYLRDIEAAMPEGWVAEPVAKSKFAHPLERTFVANQKSVVVRHPIFPRYKAVVSRWTGTKDTLAVAMYVIPADGEGEFFTKHTLIGNLKDLPKTMARLFFGLTFAHQERVDPEVAKEYYRRLGVLDSTIDGIDDLAKLGESYMDYGEGLDYEDTASPAFQRTIQKQFPGWSFVAHDVSIDARPDMLYELRRQVPGRMEVVAVTLTTFGDEYGKAYLRVDTNLIATPHAAPTDSIMFSSTSQYNPEDLAGTVQVQLERFNRPKDETPKGGWGSMFKPVTESEDTFHFDYDETPESIEEFMPIFNRLGFTKAGEDKGTWDFVHEEKGLEVQLQWHPYATSAMRSARWRLIFGPNRFGGMMVGYNANLERVEKWLTDLHSGVYSKQHVPDDWATTLGRDQDPRRPVGESVHFGYGEKLEQEDFPHLDKEMRRLGWQGKTYPGLETVKGSYYRQVVIPGLTPHISQYYAQAEVIWTVDSVQLAVSALLPKIDPSALKHFELYITVFLPTGRKRLLRGHGLHSVDDLEKIMNQVLTKDFAEKVDTIYEGKVGADHEFMYSDGSYEDEIRQLLLRAEDEATEAGEVNDDAGWWRQFYAKFARKHNLRLYTVDDLQEWTEKPEGTHLEPPSNVMWMSMDYPPREMAFEITPQGRMKDIVGEWTGKEKRYGGRTAATLNGHGMHWLKWMRMIVRDWEWNNVVGIGKA